MTSSTPSRRHFLAGAAALGLGLAAGRPALAAGLAPDSSSDQTSALAAEIARAVKSGQPLFLPAGTYHVADLSLPDNLVLTGIPGASILALAPGGRSIFAGKGAANVTLSGLGFDGSGGDPQSPALDFAALRDFTLDNCRLIHAAGHALSLQQSRGRVADCFFGDAAAAAIFAIDSTGLAITGNSITECGNAGILVWRNDPGSDGTMVANNRIANVDWRDGGNGQNGNGINIFKADDVIVSGNHISACAFSAIRINQGRNTQVTGNTCLDSGETAIFSEFGFSGSAIANNVIDGAATGISIANLDSDGHLATCSGNIIRNIAPASRTNPDTTPAGIFAEADVAITGNVIEGVPGPGISAGWGPYLRNVLVAGNIVREADIGIAVSVAAGAGSAEVSGNIIDARKAQIVGMAWTDVVSNDLAGEADKFPNVSVSGNTQGVQPKLS